MMGRCHQRDDGVRQETLLQRWPGLLAAAIVVLVLTASCAQGGDTPSKPALRLLSTSDLGADWNQRTPDNFPEPGLCGAPQPEAFKPARADAVVILEGPQFRHTVVELLFRRDIAGAQNLLEEVRRQVQSCKEFTATESRIETTTKLSLLDAPMLGDEAFAYRASVTGIPIFGPLRADTLLIRTGNLLMVLSVSSLGLNPDTGLFEMLGQKAFAKLTEQR